MRHVATLHYTEELVRSAVVSFWRRSVSWKLIVAIVVCVVGFVFLLMTGDRSWSIGVLGTAVFFAALLVAMIYVVHLRQSSETACSPESSRYLRSGGNLVYRYLGCR